MPREWLVPDWPAPPNVHAFVTTRPTDLPRDRDVVRAQVPSDPRWLRQVHGAAVVRLDDTAAVDIPEADGAVVSIPDIVAVVLTADCMPLFLADAAGDRVGVVHAGWRGMAAGVIENAVFALGGEPAQVLAWMGPAIGPGAFEVGPEVRDAFLAGDSGADACFRPGRPGKLMADLYGLARRRLERAGVRRVSGGGFCTFMEPHRFFSYRREKQGGRMGAFIWRT